MFENRDAWFHHELQMHRVEYFCNAEAHPTYRNLSEFQDHMQRKHDISLAELSNPAAMNMFRRPASLSGGICNLCFREQPVKNMKIHVSKHLEQVSLFAIPRAEYGEDDADARENQSYQAQHNWEESNSQDDEEESISQDDEGESISQDDEKKEPVSQDEEQESLSDSEKDPVKTERILLAQYAAQLQGEMPKAHANAVGLAVHHDYHPDSTTVNPVAPPYDTHLAVPRTTSRHRIGLPDPPSSAGHPSPEQPRHASLPHSSSSSSYFCCGRTYGSKFTFNRHRRESRTCPHGSGGRRFVCCICANTDQPFGRRASLKQHVREEHGRSPEEAHMEVDAWYGRYGEEKDYPKVVKGYPEVVKDSPEEVVEDSSEVVKDSPEVMKDLDRP